MQLSNLKKPLLIGGFLVLVAAALQTSLWLANNPEALAVMERAGYVGVFLLGLISGLNAFIPIPAATFSTLYVAANLNVLGIIIALTFGVLLADLIGYWFGSQFRDSLQTKYSTIKQFSQKVSRSHPIIIWLFIFLYAAFVPFPNEAMVIPLAISGVRLHHLLPPLVIGGFVHQALLVLGVTSLTNLF